MYLKIKKAELVEAKYGKNIVISMIGLYDDNNKRVKRVKLDQETADMITTMPILLSNDNENMAS